jgi:hypothetical protein
VSVAALDTRRIYAPLTCGRACSRGHRRPRARASCPSCPALSRREGGGRRGAGPACPARLRLPPRVPTRTISARDVDGAARAVQGASACAARLARGPAHTGTPPCAHIRAYTLTGVCRRRSRTRNACVCSVCMRALTSADYMRCGRDARSGSTRRGTSISSRGSRSARTTTRTPILTRTRTPTPIPRCAPG